MQEIKRRESKHDTTESHQHILVREQENKKGTAKNYKNNNMAVTTYLSIITLSVNGLKCSNQKTLGDGMDRKT